MDPSRGDSRYNLNYSMNSIGLSLADQADLYGNPAATAALVSTTRPPSGGLIQPMGGRNSGGGGLQMSNSNQCHSLNNSTAGQQQQLQQSRGLKRTSSDCYDEQQQHRAMTTQSLQGLESCGGGPGGNGTNSGGTVTAQDVNDEQYTSLQNKKSPPANGKKTKGRVKIKMEYIDNKLRRYTTFSKRKTGIMKKAYELSTLTGTQVMLLVASETGHVYTFATRKLQPMITSEAGKQLIQTCLNSPDPPNVGGGGDQRMSATGFEETELSYNIADEDSKDDRSPISSGNETDDSSDIDSPGPVATNFNSGQTIMVDDSPHHHAQSHGKQMVYYDDFKITPTPNQNINPSTSSSSSANMASISSQCVQSTSQNQQVQQQENISQEVLLKLVQSGHLPQDVLMRLVQSGDLQLHTEEDGQYITIPLPMTTGGNTSASTSSSSANISERNNSVKDLSIKGGGNASNVNRSNRHSPPSKTSKHSMVIVKKEVMD